MRRGVIYQQPAAGNTPRLHQNKPDRTPIATPRRICVLRLSALGDVVLAAAAVTALCGAERDAEVTWITDRAFLPVLRGLPHNVRLLPVDKPRSLADYLALRRQLRGQQFDILLAMQASFRANLIYPQIRAPLKIGFDAPRSRELHSLFINDRIAPGDGHLLDWFMAFVEAAGVPDAQPHWTLQLDPAAQAWARAATGGQPYLLINPRASKPTRNWPLTRNAQIARLAMHSPGIAVVLCGGPGEGDRAAAREIAQQAPGVIDLSGQTDLPKLFALVAGARVLLSPDSGPVHIARAFDVPVVGLYADARPAKTGPYRRMRWCVDRWPEAVRQILKRDPARVAWDTRVHDARAMELITVEDVAVQLASALRAGAPSTITA